MESRNLGQPPFIETIFKLFKYDCIPIQKLYRYVMLATSVFILTEISAI